MTGAKTSRRLPKKSACSNNHPALISNTFHGEEKAERASPASLVRTVSESNLELRGGSLDYF